MITYETKNTHPGTLPCATIYLGGLVCLSFDHANKCTVGVNSSVGNGHIWKLSIVEQTTNGTVPVLEQVNNPDIQEIHIDVHGSTTQGTYVYNGPFARLTSNEQRFNLETSWIDLEGPRGHDKPIKNNTNTLWPRFYINEGLFCASKLSIQTFALKNTNRQPLIKPLGNIALGIVADIFVERKRGSKIEVKLPDQTVSLDSRKRYEIHITNDCDNGYAGPVETDFHLHYNAFSSAFDRNRGMMKADQFHLVKHNTASAKNNSAVARAVVELDPASDRAPCMGIALGQTSAFNA